MRRISGSVPRVMFLTTPSPTSHSCGLLYLQQARAGGVLVFLEDQLRSFCNAAGQAASAPTTGRKGSRSQIVSSTAISELEFLVFSWEDVSKQLIPPEGSAIPIGCKDWLCENLLVADGQEPTDTMCLGSAALDDLPRLRGVIESLLDTQVWLLPFKRVSQVRGGVTGSEGDRKVLE